MVVTSIDINTTLTTIDNVVDLFVNIQP
jgi:hypothetical protein